jgi:RNA polymerase sigma factor (TIGR02999 family)
MGVRDQNWRASMYFKVETSAQRRGRVRDDLRPHRTISTDAASCMMPPMTHEQGRHDPALSGSADVTVVLDGVSAGRLDAGRDLLPLVYTQLRAAAQAQMDRETTGHTLSATAVVHEAYMRLVGERHVPWANRAHFYAAAAQAMRRVLIDHARAKHAQRRGGGRARAALDLGSVADAAGVSDPGALLALDAAMERLEREQPEVARVVHLRFYAGLSVEQTALALDVSARTVKRDWAFARAWLLDTLRADAAREAGDGGH